MTVDTITVPVTALEILRSDGVDVEERLRTHAAVEEARGRLGMVSSSLRAAAFEEIAAATLRFLGIEVGDVMLAGWRKYRELLDAGTRTLGTVDSTIVDLAGRDLRLTQRPRIELSWREKAIATFQFEVSMGVRVEAVSATVQDGKLVSLTTGRCLADVDVELNGQALAHAEHPVDPHLCVRLGSGVRLVGAD